MTLDEVMQIEDAVDVAWGDLSATAQAVIDRQGVAYTDEEGDLVTSIVGGKDCVFTYYDDITDQDSGQNISGCCLCALEKAFRAGRSHFCKPIMHFKSVVLPTPLEPRTQRISPELMSKLTFFRIVLVLLWYEKLPFFTSNCIFSSL